jgi:phage N-6-adenine-methyltransferase
MKPITRSKATDEWRTPPALYGALLAEFDFDLDLAATSANAMQGRWLGPGGLAEDSLTVPWRDHGRCGFLNPPYSAKLIGPFMQKAAESSRDGFTTAALVKLDTSTQWWEWTRAATEIRVIPHRVPFLKADGTSKAGAMFPSAIVVFRPQPGLLRGQPRWVVWSWLAPKATKPAPRASRPTLAAELVAAGDQYQWLRGLLHEASAALTPPASTEGR